MQFYVSSIVLLFSLFLSTAVWAEEGKTADDLKKIQGEWTYTNVDALGRKLLYKVEYVGQKMTFSVTDDGGKVLLQQACDFELQKTEQVRIITYSNVVALLGPGVPRPSEATQDAWIYRIAGGRMTCIRGVMNRDDPKPGFALQSWVRSPKKTADTRSQNDKDGTVK
jgi:uncharacterized protein (TIGR03067 family)